MHVWRREELAALERDLCELALASPVALATAPGGLFRDRSALMKDAARAVGAAAVAASHGPGVELVEKLLRKDWARLSAFSGDARDALMRYRMALRALGVDTHTGARALWALATAYRFSRVNRIWLRFMWRHYAPVMFEAQAPAFVSSLARLEVFAPAAPGRVRVVRRAIASVDYPPEMSALFRDSDTVGWGSFAWRSSSDAVCYGSRRPFALAPSPGAAAWRESRNALRRALAHLLRARGFLTAPCALEVAPSPERARIAVGEVRKYNEASSRIIRAALPAGWHERVVRQGLVVVERMLVVWASAPQRSADGGTQWKVWAMRPRRGGEAFDAPVVGYVYRDDERTVFSRSRRDARSRCQALRRREALALLDP